MKLHLTIDKPINGYLNLSPTIKPEFFPYCQIEEWAVGDLKALDELVEDAECLEILAEDILDYIPRPDLEKFLIALVRKLRHKGTLILGGVDAISVSRKLWYSEINLQKFNELVFGVGIAKEGLTYIREIHEALAQLGLVIEKKQLDGIYFIVQAKRP